MSCLSAATRRQITIAPTPQLFDRVWTPAPRLHGNQWGYLWKALIATRCL